MIRFVLILFVVTAAGSVKPNAVQVDGNQVVFRDRGSVVNQGTFLHLEVTVDIGPYLRDIKKFKNDIEYLYLQAKSEPRNPEYVAEIQDPVVDKGIDDRGPNYQKLKEAVYHDASLMLGYMKDLTGDYVERLEDIVKILPNNDSISNMNLAHNRIKRSPGQLDWIAVMSERVATAARLGDALPKEDDLENVDGNIIRSYTRNYIIGGNKDMWNDKILTSTYLFPKINNSNALDTSITFENVTDSVKDTNVSSMGNVSDAKVVEDVKLIKEPVGPEDLNTTNNCEICRNSPYGKHIFKDSSGEVLKTPVEMNHSMFVSSCSKCLDMSMSDVEDLFALLRSRKGPLRVVREAGQPPIPDPTNKGDVTDITDIMEADFKTLNENDLVLDWLIKVREENAALRRKLMSTIPYGGDKDQRPKRFITTPMPSILKSILEHHYTVEKEMKDVEIIKQQMDAAKASQASSSPRDPSSRDDERGDGTSKRNKRKAETFDLDSNPAELKKRLEASFVKIKTEYGMALEKIEKESKNFDFNTRRILYRQKRFITGLLGSYFGIKSNYKVNELLKHFNEFKDKNFNRVVNALEIVKYRSARLEVDHDLLVQMQLIMAKRKPLRLVAAAMQIQRNLESKNEKLIDAITAAQYQRLSPNLLTGEELQILFTGIENIAKRENCLLFISQPSDLFQVEVSFYYQKNTESVHLFLHVPLVKHKDQLVLKEYVPFPLAQSFELNATVLPDVGDVKYIAVGNDGILQASAKGRYRTFTEAELSTCSTLGDLYLCPGRNTLKKKLSETCIGSLIQRDPNNIVKNCPMKIKRAQEYVARLGFNQWLVSSHQPQYVNPTCVGEASANLMKITKQTVVTLTENCHLDLEEHFLSTDININSEYAVQTFTFDDLGNVFKEFFDNTTELSRVIHEALLKRDSIVTGDLQHLKATETILSEFPLDNFFSSIGEAFMQFLSFGTFAFAAVFVALICGACCICRGGGLGCIFNFCKGLTNCPVNEPRPHQDLVWSRPPSRAGSVKLPRIVVTPPENEERPSRPSSRNSNTVPKTITFEEPATIEVNAATAPALQEQAAFPEAATTHLSVGALGPDFRDRPPPYNTGFNSNLYPSLSLGKLNFTGTPKVLKRSLDKLGSTWTVASAFKSLAASNGEAEDFDLQQSFRPKNQIPCKVGLANRKGLSMDKWRCTHHMPETGCMGSFVDD